MSKLGKICMDKEFLESGEGQYMITEWFWKARFLPRNISVDERRSVYVFEGYSPSFMDVSSEEEIPTYRLRVIYANGTVVKVWMQKT